MLNMKDHMFDRNSVSLSSTECFICPCYNSLGFKPSLFDEATYMFLLSSANWKQLRTCDFLPYVVAYFSSYYKALFYLQAYQMHRAQEAKSDKDER